MAVCILGEIINSVVQCFYGFLIVFSISSSGHFLNQGLLQPLVTGGVESHTTGAESHKLKMRLRAQGDFLEELDRWRCNAGR